MAIPTAVQDIRLDRIRPSKTNPRKRVRPGYMEELTATIKKHGVVQPIRVRPLGKADEGYEIVFGECRWKASKAAARETIPCIVTPLDEETVLDLQIIENSQRDDVHPLDEAEGYAHLQKRGASIQAIADRVGKPASHIAQRLKLCTLSAKCLKALEADEITMGVANLLAKLPTAAIQDRALEEVNRHIYDDNAQVTVAEARKIVERDVMLDLSEAPFDTTDPLLVESAGACATCPKRTGAQALLFADASSPDLCTDSGCYKGKADAFFKVRSKTVVADGGEVLTKKDARSLLVDKYSTAGHALRAKYVPLSEKEHVGGRGHVKVSQILKQAKLDVPQVIAQNPETGQVVVLARAKDVEAARRKISKEKEPAPGARDAGVDKAANARQRAAEKRGLAVMRALMAALVANFEETFRDVTKEEAVAFLDMVMESAWSDVVRRAIERRGGKVEVGGAAARDKYIQAWVKGATSAQIMGFSGELLAGRVAGRDRFGARSMEFTRLLSGFGIERKHVEAKAIADLKAQDDAGKPRTFKVAKKGGARG